MGRSIRLGHCVCNPRKPCPCDLFKERDVCLCAGEQLEPDTGPVRLTQLVENPGCASKIDQASLKRVLQYLPFDHDPRVLVGAAAGDDAGVYQLDKRTALVQTVDVFTPSVDDPYTFGQIAAANSVSDVYAMGGRPLTALSILSFPIRELPDAIMHDILRGGLDKMAEAGAVVIGGHSINDREIKAGFAVTGLIDPTRIMTNAGAKPGDALILTKPLGTGIIAFAAQIDRAPDVGGAPAGAMDAAARSMAALNKVSAELMIRYGAHACTDITGFGLMGHLGEVAARSTSAGPVDVEILWDALPLLPGVAECLAEGVIPGAVERNRESSAHRMTADNALSQAMLDICFDAQTSGGLLIVLPKAKARPLLSRLHKSGITDAAIIGQVLSGGSGRVIVRTTRTRELPKMKAKQSSKVVSVSAPRPESSCCPESHGASQTQKKLQAFLAAANAPGTLDAHTKQAIAVALSVMAKCEPCARIHIEKARGMGFSQEQIDEAAWMAIAFGGSPLWMFYNGLKKSA